jgi:tetratricopeptide (TPR) repeat protein
MPNWEETLSLGKDQLNQGHVDEALVLLEQAAAEAGAGSGKDDRALAVTNNELANAHIWYGGDATTALKAARRAAVALGRAADSLSVLGVMADVAMNLFILGDAKRSITLAKRAQAIAVKATRRQLDVTKPDLKDALTDLLLSLHIIGLPDGLREVADRHVTPLLKKNHLAYFNLDEIQLLGVTCERTGSNAECGQFYSYATDMLAHESDPDLYNFGNVLAQIADKLEGFGRIDTALVLYHLAKLVQQAVYGRDHPHSLWAATRLVQKYLEYDDARQAELTILSESQRDNRNNPDNTVKAAYYHYLGYYSRLIGDLDNSQLFLTRAVRMMERLHGWENPKLAAVLLDLGRVYYEQGQFRAALRHLHRSLELQHSERKPNVEMMIETFDWLATVTWWGENELNNAIRQMTVFERREYVEEKKLAGRIAANIKRVETVFQRIRKVIEKTGAPDHSAQLLSSMGDFFFNFQKNDRAQKIYEILWDSTKDAPDAVAARLVAASRLGAIHRAKRAVAKAETFLKVVLDGADALDEEQAAYYRADAVRELGRIQAIRGDTTGAIAHLEDAVKRYQRLEMDPAVETVLEELVRLHDGAGDAKGVRSVQRRLKNVRSRLLD